MSKHYVFLLFILIPWRLFSQGEANIWYFGEYAGLDFNSGSPVALTDGQLFSFEGCATQSDVNGNLLFYTNGNIVWNRNHDTLSNGAGLNGEISSTQSAMILPKPGSPNKYYIFTTTQAQRANNWVFCYSEVDMSLDGGLGGITSLKNVQLFEPISEKITAVKHANNQDIWVITHDKFSNKYLTYAITNAGVNSTPLIFSGGTIDTGSGDGFPSPNWGYLKASPDGNTLASAIMLMNKVDILNFNKATGQISLRYTIDQETPYGVEFSPSGQLLYVTSLWVLSMKQYDLTLPTASAVVSNAYNFSSLNSTAPCALQLGPDEKIYVSSAGDTAVACIQNPDQQGVGCNFTPRHISLNGRMNYLGLPNFFQNYLTPSGIKHLGSCENDTTFFSLENSLPFDSIHWNFGDIGSGILNSSNDSSTFHIYQNPGDYLVQAIIFQNGQSRIINKPVSIFTIPNISLGPDTFFCNFEIINLNVAGFIDGYAYSTHPEIITNNFFDIEFLTGIPEGERWITVENGCGVSSDTILIAQKFPPLDFYLPEEGIICEGEVGNYCLTSYPSEGNYLWQDGSTEEVFCIEQAGIYYVQVSNECGVKSDTMVVSTYPKPTADLGSDTTICNTNPLMLYPQGNFDYFMWTYGSTDTPFFVNTSGQYTIYAYNAYCSVLDTIQVTVDSIVPQPFSLGIDQSLCEGTSYFIGTLPAVGNYLWQDGSTEPEHLLSEAGEYYVTVSNQCGAQSDTMLITEIIPLPSVDLGNDTTICQGSIPPLVLYPQGIFDYYGWQNPGFFGTVIVTESETYAVSVYNACGVASDTIQVTVDTITPATLDLGEDTFICEGESLTVSIDQPGVSFLWNDGSTDSVFTTSISALIIGSALNACGQQSDTLQVFYFPIPDVDAGSDISICNATEVSLTANSNTNTYLWQNGSSQNTITVNEPGWYWVSSTNNCGEATDSVFVQVGQVTEASLILDSCEPIWVNGISYNESGIYSQTLVNISGCDSILTIDAEILNSTAYSISISDCKPILVNGISYNNSGIYTQTLNNSSGCDSVITISAEILEFNAQIFQQDTTLYYNGNPTSIQWINCTTGQAIPGATQTSFVPQTTGNYGAIITIGECVDTSNCRQIIQSSAPEKPGSLCDNIIVSPNPVHEQIEFTLDKSNYDIRLFTSTGALIISTKGNAQKQIINFRELAPAMYVLQVDECRYKIFKQ